ncbi:PH domain-containing protein [Halorientalis regularis]|uniref:Putative membrane protein n=1 Tax=Halorientalis regularis TaxID=660518 RepID=A0A1G7FKH4_9EURY|nr:PH domain-containing protein [Halorientalis regularis]SDE76376.1 putative membrane protein [Halorientalis regularis]
MKLHPLSAVTRSLQRGLVAASMAFVLTGIGRFVAPELLGSFALIAGLFVLLFVVGVAYGVAYYYRFEYALTPDTFDVYSGVIGRQEREIPYRRIQNVDVTESIFHRIVGVAIVQIETAGGSETEATLNFVAADEARRLQREVRDRRARAREDDTADTDEAEPAETERGATAAATDSPSETRHTDPEAVADRLSREGDLEPETTLFELGSTELLVLALTSFQLASVAFLLFGFPIVEDLLVGLFASVTGIEAPVDALTSTPDLAILIGLLAVAFAAVTMWAVSTVVTFLQYYGFTLGRQGEDLVYERGLLQRYSGSIPTDKIQTLTIQENVLMRALGYAGFAVETAGYSPGQSDQGPQSAIPLADREHTLALARELEPFDELSFTRSPKRARRRYAVRYGLVVLGLSALTFGLSVAVPAFGLWYLPLFLLIGVPPAAHLKWKHRGYCVGEDHFVVRDGFWNRKTRIVPYYRLQTVIRQRTVFQRRLDLAHLTADTATASLLGRQDATAYDIEADVASDLYELNRERLQASLHGGT